MRLKRFFKKKKRRVIALVLLGVTIMVLCQMAFGKLPRSAPPSVEAFNRASIKHVGPRKKKSLERWKSHQIGGKKATEFALARTSLVVTAELPLKLTPSLPVKLTPSKPDPKRDASPGQSDSKSGEQNRLETGGGTATAITSDGYWLTAGHVTELAHVYLASTEREEHPPYAMMATKLHPARVVWTGEKGDPSTPDLSLIYCSHLSDHHFPLLRPPILSPDAEVLAAGYGVGGPSLFAGRILKRGPNKGTQLGPQWMVYLSDAPVIPGDSGGPLLTTEGQLLGVNVSGQFGVRSILGWQSLVDYRARTICPDTDWIRKLILKDRKQERELNGGNS